MTGATFATVADGVVMVVLWVSVVVRRMPRTARLPLALMSFGSAWTLCFFLTRLHFPRWTWLVGGVAVLISIAFLVLAAQLSLPSDSGGASDDGDGGLGTRPPDRPIGGGGPAEPSWWPEFERELARYQSGRERTEQEALIGR